MSKFDFKHEPEAMRNAPAPHSLTGIDLLAYYALCYIYRLYKDKAIDRTTGTNMKQSIVAAHESATLTQNKYSGIWARIEQSASNYTHTSTIENADKFYAAVYGLPDDWRNGRNKAATADVPWCGEQMEVER